MNSTITALASSDSGATTQYTAFLPGNRVSVRRGTRRPPFGKERKQKTSSVTATTAVTLANESSAEGPTILGPALSVEELLNGPLFQVAGIFEIDVPGWAERHDELLGEAYR